MIKISNISDFDSKLLPIDPGVYLFKDNEDVILYCGKAKNLRNRVSNYFSKTSNLSIKTQHLVSKIRIIEWIIVGNEVEALLLENKMIKKYSPKYNISLKDSKTFAYIALTKEKFPRIISSRRTGSKIETFGPYTDGTMRRELQRLVVSIFKIRTCKVLPKRACLNYHIGICTAPCIENVSYEQYKNQVEKARIFLNGKYDDIAHSLKEKMDEASKNMQYERARELYNQIKSIELISKKQIVDNEKKYDQDIMVFMRSNERVMIVQMGIRKGVLLGKKDFVIDYQDNFEYEFLRAFYTSNPIPHEILLNENCWVDNNEKLAIEDFLANLRGGPVRINVPLKGERKKLIDLAKKNIDLNMEHDAALFELQNSLNLPSLPIIIESFDISNIGDEHIVSGMVRFVNAKPDKSGYRKFKIKTVHMANDFASIQEVVYRRYSRLQRENSRLPDLILIDGGAEQLSFAIKSLEKLGLSIPIIGLAKKMEDIYLPSEVTPRKFNNNSKMMLLLRKIRDETHNFSLNYNKKRRQMKMREEFSSKLLKNYK